MERQTSVEFSLESSAGSEVWAAEILSQMNGGATVHLFRTVLPMVMTLALFIKLKRLKDRLEMYNHMLPGYKTHR